MILKLKTAVECGLLSPGDPAGVLFEKDYVGNIQEGTATNQLDAVVVRCNRKTGVIIVLDADFGMLAINTNIAEGTIRVDHFILN